jgi:hypothetical protein
VDAEETAASRGKEAEGHGGGWRKKNRAEKTSEGRSSTKKWTSDDEMPNNENNDFLGEVSSFLRLSVLFSVNPQIVNTLQRACCVMGATSSSEFNWIDDASPPIDEVGRKEDPSSGDCFVERQSTTRKVLEGRELRRRRQQR